jgi:hypothetical protein
MKLRNLFKIKNRKIITVIPFKVEDSVALFALIKGEHGSFEFISGIGEGKDAAERAFLMQTGASYLRIIELSNNAFAFETADISDLKFVFLQYEEALKKLTNPSHRESLRELFYKPQPL